MISAYLRYRIWETCIGVLFDGINSNWKREIICVKMGSELTTEYIGRNAIIDNCLEPGTIVEFELPHHWNVDDEDCVVIRDNVVYGFRMSSYGRTTIMSNDVVRILR